jgi:hypothetical protein
MNNEIYETSQKMVFIREEIQRFDENDNRPFRVAIADNGRASYAYGSHTEERMYADLTIGYTHDRNEARSLLAEAWDTKQEIISEAYAEMED